MPNATVVSSWHDGQTAYLAIAVDGDNTDHEGNPARTEYVGSLPLADLDELTPEAQKDALIAAAKAVRDQAIAQHHPIDISGTVAV